jgi:hypothetical protein
MIEAIPGSDGLRAELTGLRLAPLTRTLRTDGSATWWFRIIGCDGNAIRRFDRRQGKLLHLIIVRTDLTGYQHMHPVLDRHGTFSVQIAERRAGTYRAIADFVADGRKYVLGTNLTAPGPVRPAPLPPSALHASTDGHLVELKRLADLRAGNEELLTFRLTRHGCPVIDFQAYLGAYGHLVALHARSSPIRTCTPTARIVRAARSRSTPSYTSPTPTGCSSSSRPKAVFTSSPSPRPSLETTSPKGSR